jgi:hypothetical protein
MPTSPDIRTFRRRLAETIAWCAARGAVDNPRDGLRTPALRPPSLYKSRTHRRHSEETGPNRPVVAEALAEERARLLRSAGSYPSGLAEDLAGGRLLGYDPDANLSDGFSEIKSNGFFDVDNMPPWDTWICYVAEREEQPWRHFDSYLISWVPPSHLALAGQGVWFNAEECIVWADELDTPFIEQLRAAGLLASP